MALYFFRRGHTYMAGADVPFFVSEEDVLEGAIEEGFKLVVVVDREDGGDPPIVLPQSARSKDWNLWGTGVWGKPDGELDLPSAVAWVADLTPFGVQAQPPGAPPPPPQPPVITMIDRDVPIAMYVVGAAVTGGAIALVSHALSRGRS